ncbi:hypothetical protein APUTEX25_005487 [Auxenochlorella protothecoides]|uniref:Uncharacterized protein n=1 Tax=Auxenochlorella protothecoides TaxID=3075 RepID=A0A3M7KZ80_AUXPR|nr:hypothetical protein APUTEX25_005487 [Auxenochlorella protothecoides]|eukprot:RMZ55209.1 hypothetical protein APUTEX25_005487 [Auxenochlorella protothecoides]
MGTTHTEEVRKKISAAMRLSHAKRRQKAEAARAASGVQMLELEATLMRRHDPAHQNLPSLLELLGPQELRDIAAGGGGTEGMRALARERLVMSVTSLRHELSAWMQAQAAERGATPSMRATASSHPAVYAKFVRFVALKQALRHLEEGRQGSSIAPMEALDIEIAAAQLFSSQASARDCTPAEDLPVAGLDLSAEERVLLKYLCIPQRDLLLEDEDIAVVRRGIPPGVNCTEVQWCDGESQCSLVCERGSVVIPDWQVHAIRTQLDAQADVPLCRASLLGSHNSAITLADGYGNLDEYWQGYFRYIKWAIPAGASPRLRTNNHWLSLTDQLRMGVRVLELDAHWVGGALRIAHCGGLHVPQLNALVKALNLVAKLLGRRIRWDTETLGCSPSLSSIPALDQRTLLDALGEVAAWMGGEGAAGDALVLFFDDQADLAHWGVVGELLGDVLRAFPRAWPRPQPPLARGPSLHGWFGALARAVWDLLGFARVQLQYRPAGCAVIDAASGRWESVSCAQDLHNACRAEARLATNGTAPAWWLAADWVVAPGARGECPPGTRADAPRHGVENAALSRAVRAANRTAAWLPLAGGPSSWTLDALPAWS